MDDAHKELAKRLLETYWAGAPYMRELLDKSADALEALAGEVERLKAALAPFAEILSLLEDPSVAQLGDEFETSFTAPDDYIVQAHPVPCHDMETSSDYVTICTVGDLRKARKALGGDAS